MVWLKFVDWIQTYYETCLILTTFLFLFQFLDDIWHNWYGPITYRILKPFASSNINTAAKPEKMELQLTTYSTPKILLSASETLCCNNLINLVTLSVGKLRLRDIEEFAYASNNKWLNQDLNSVQWIDPVAICSLYSSFN